MASPGLREDYEGCVNLYQDYIAQHTPTQRDYNGSQVGSTVEVNAVDVAGYHLAMSPSPASRLTTVITSPKSMLRSTPSRKRSSRPSATSAGTSRVRRRSEEEVQMMTSWINLGVKSLNSSPPSQERKERTPKATPMTLTTSQARSPTARMLPSPINVARNDLCWRP